MSYIYDRLLAEAETRGSTYRQRHPALDRWWGVQGYPSPVYLQWRIANITAYNVVNWQEFAGCKESGLIPRSFRRAAKVTIDKKLLDEFQQRLEGKQAVAYSIGDIVMMGTATEAQFLGTDPDDASKYAAAMGVGKGVLKAEIGIDSPQYGLVIPTDTLGFQDGPTFAPEDTPASIPGL